MAWNRRPSKGFQPSSLQPAPTNGVFSYGFAAYDKVEKRTGNMTVQIFVANTDADWFDFLSAKPALTEVNFWQPSGTMTFRAIQPGELFAFRLKSPRDKIGGFGVLSGSTILPLQMAWETFEQANGYSSYDEMRTRIAKYRPNDSIRPTTNIGCRILTQPIFLPSEQWISLPDSWSRNIVTGKRYATDTEEGLLLWNRLQEAAQIVLPTAVSGFEEPQARYGAPTLIAPRLGQGAFRVAVTETYHRQCAVSQGKVLPALDAAHIRPYGEGGSHLKSNGILLRKDIHCVLDAGYATVDTDYKFVVSTKIKEAFNNGDEYLHLHGKALSLPSQQSDWPDREALRWHNENRFLK
jgi:HNH endonuclease